jgi:hypothetical protein
MPGVNTIERHIQMGGTPDPELILETLSAMAGDPKELKK